jgi:competence ComEA-like helix-hairpin-helix protein
MRTRGDLGLTEAPARCILRVSRYLTAVALIAAAASMDWATAAVTSEYPSAQTSSDHAQERQPEPPPEFRRVCVRCHASDRVMEGRRFPSQWEQVLEQMVARGATGSDEDFDIVFEYLVTQFGRVAINTAAADEIAQVLHLEAAMGETIVQHRSKHGTFADFDALAAVPGLDVAELRKRRDAIVF